MQKKGKASYMQGWKRNRPNHKTMFKARSLARAKAKAQSAMEYLMTYGWAILIIAVVLGALFQLGVFNANNFSPKAPPGACQVFRPNGPGTTFDINLEGECQGELPEYVAEFNGNTSWIPIGADPYVLNPNLKAATVTLWFKYMGLPAYSSGGGGLPFTDEWAQQVSVGSNTTTIYYGGCMNGGNWKIFKLPNPYSWHFFAITGSDTSGEFLYLDGQQVYANTIGSSNLVGVGQFVSIGGTGTGGPHCCGYNYNGLLANVQFYNTSLSSNEIQALYQEGIGGAPIDLQHLAGWWPLNGNANDYSGNGNHGVPNNVVFINNWWQGYTPP
ncbi:MAG: LamG-like jellyroll fold domain-containing protein [Candidatus Micrarchaeia archaeon]